MKNPCNHRGFEAVTLRMQRETQGTPDPCPWCEVRRLIGDQAFMEAKITALCARLDHINNLTRPHLGDSLNKRMREIEELSGGFAKVTLKEAAEEPQFPQAQAFDVPGGTGPSPGSAARTTDDRLLVERLREPDGGIFTAHELCRQAADEIDRLLRGFSMVKEFSDGSSRAWAIAYEALYHRPYTIEGRKDV